MGDMQTFTEKLKQTLPENIKLREFTNTNINIYKYHLQDKQIIEEVIPCYAQMTIQRCYHIGNTHGAVIDSMIVNRNTPTRNELFYTEKRINCLLWKCSLIILLIKVRN